MRINLFVASATGLSRRAADKAIAVGDVTINDRIAELGDRVSQSDTVKLNHQVLQLESKQTIMFNKPVGYVCSRNGQGSPTIYDLLPVELHSLKPVGRLDKDSSGLLLLTNSGKLANKLTHPSFFKQKIYQISLNKDLSDIDKSRIESGIQLEDGVSKLSLDGRNREWKVTMSEGRNRQIRRTFATLGYKVIQLHRIKFGDYQIGDLTEGKYLPVK